MYNVAHPCILTFYLQLIIITTATATAAKRKREKKKKNIGKRSKVKWLHTKDGNNNANKEIDGKIWNSQTHHNRTKHNEPQKKRTEKKHKIANEKTQWMRQKNTTFKVKYKANIRDNDDDPTKHVYTWESLNNYIVFLSLAHKQTRTHTVCVSH